jgi:hypothetical protein
MASSSSSLDSALRATLGRSCRVLLKCNVRLETKAGSDKTEPRLLVLTQYRLLTVGVKAKIEHNVHYLDIRKVESKRNNQVGRENPKGKLSNSQLEKQEVVKCYIGPMIWVDRVEH